MLAFGGIWTLEVWVRKAVGCFKCCLMDYTGWIMEDGGAAGVLNYGGLAQGV